MGSHTHEHGLMKSLAGDAEKPRKEEYYVSDAKQILETMEASRSGGWWDLGGALPTSRGLQGKLWTSLLPWLRHAHDTRSGASGLLDAILSCIRLLPPYGK